MLAISLAGFSNLCATVTKDCTSKSECRGVLTDTLPVMKLSEDSLKPHLPFQGETAVSPHDSGSLRLTVGLQSTFAKVIDTGSLTETLLPPPTGSVPCPARGDIIIWMCGHSFVKWAAKQAMMRKHEKQVGLDGLKIRVEWHGCGNEMERVDPDEFELLVGVTSSPAPLARALACRRRHGLTARQSEARFLPSAQLEKSRTTWGT
ncbi:hypothetical protein NDU88_001558 [Pleurodeles waltl]|uniref:Uncharacterized protein n=1 Tax=Pleurodeles waltl TaxID=8319 RepID=A0AAV7LYY4_PLEWA|nr:hypothetical protein NDU88_001558 [Pleurodeles waltl]